MICETSLIAEHYLTMSHPTAPKVVPYNNKLYPSNLDLQKANDQDAIPENEVIIADGLQRPVVVFNRTIPGPDIIVYEGQTLIIHVTNRMHSEILGVHWHGLFQRNTPFMDGVPFVTQCPILPGQTFTYRFQAYPKGTFWYYSVTGLQRIKGASGALIIRSNTEDAIEHIMQVQEWYVNRDTNDASLPDNQERTKIQNSQKLLSIDGSTFKSPFVPVNALINGKGDVNGLQLHTFYIYEGTPFLFRALGIGAVLPFQISIDGHKLNIIESNGYRIKEVTVDSFIINPGERIAFTITKFNSKSHNFWIRAKTLIVNSSIEAKAILRYRGNMEQPMTERKKCTTDDRCLVFNCPFKNFPIEQNKQCITADQVDSLEPTFLSKIPKAANFKEYFLNLEFPGTSIAAINSRHFLLPPVSALTQPSEISTSCNGQCDQCQCTYSINFLHNETIHLVLTNMGEGRGWGHPVHLHGHSFELMKIGFPTYDKITGLVLADNEEIRCERIKSSKKYTQCQYSIWSDPSWSNGNLPGLNLINPPRKDTVVIPSGGYAVIRIRANNPGLWLLHSLVDHQSSFGMSVLFNESFPFVHQPSRDFPKCGNYNGFTTPLHR